jgi:antagonist of KipI
MAINILDAGFLTTVQDLGRHGYQRFGVPLAGAMDRFALAAANLLVYNPPGAAALEVGLQGAEFELDEDNLVAVTGSGFELRIDGKTMPLWTAVFARAGSRIALVKKGMGCWAYLGTAGGGILSEVELGSRSTYIRGGFGQLCQAGDWLKCGAPPKNATGKAGRTLPPGRRPPYGESVTVAAVCGPQEELFSAAGMETFFASEYGISSNSDRMGYRLEGAAVEHQGSADILSEGMLFGSVQVPASGQPIVMMSECGATGGYSKIATVVSADLPLLAQCTPGSGRVRFRQTTVEEAQQRYRALTDGLFNGIEEAEEDVYGY